MADRGRLYAKLHVLIAQQGVDKMDIYAGYGVSSATEMTDAQLIDCVSRLEGRALKQYSTTTTGDTELAVRRLRSEVLSLLTKSPAVRDVRKRGLGLPNDWEILNPWIERHAGARLNKLSAVELETFRRQLLALRAKGWHYKTPTLEAHTTATTSLPGASVEAETNTDVAQVSKPKTIQVAIPLIIQSDALPS